MTPSARLQAVLDLLTEIEKTPRAADAIVSAYFRSRRYIGSKDRASIAKTFYDVLRHHARLGWWLEQKSQLHSPRNRLLGYLSLVAQKSPETISELFSGGKYAPATINGAEQELLRKLKGHTLEHPAMPEDVRVECPDWVYGPLKKLFGKNITRELGAMLAPAPLDLRINSLKTTHAAVLKALQAAGIRAEPCALSPWGIRVHDRPSLASLPMLKDGLVEIQDEGSQLIALLVNAQPGQRIVDFCAGAGGKTLAIAAQMKNKGRIIACDVLSGRLKRGTERFRRAGLHNIEIKPLKNENDPWVKKHKASFDRVLVDAPCSGTGTWRRNPDSRWRSLGPGLASLLNLQKSILQSAARLVKPGGYLIYATCSLLPDENEKQMEEFLKTHPDFKAVNCREILPNLPLGKDGSNAYLRLTPLQHGTDGFFGAAMQKHI